MLVDGTAGEGCRGGEGPGSGSSYEVRMFCPAILSEECGAMKAGASTRNASQLLENTVVPTEVETPVFPTSGPVSVRSEPYGKVHDVLPPSLLSVVPSLLVVSGLLLLLL